MMLMLLLVGQHETGIPGTNANRPQFLRREDRLFKNWNPVGWYFTVFAHIVRDGSL